MCGFLSIYGPEGQQVLQEILDGLLAIQHRGQDAAGVVTFDGDKFRAKKGLGLVREVFGKKHQERLIGNIGVGHVRYPTVGAGEDMDVQPFWLDFPLGIAMAHNGNVSNFQELKKEYFPAHDMRIPSDCDLEAVLYVMARALLGCDPRKLGAKEIHDAVAEVFRTVKGAYSVVGIIAGKGMFAFRDPFGIKPIVFGQRETSEGIYYALASESVALEIAGYKQLRNLEPGESLWIDKDRVVHSKRLTDKPHRPCIFEHVYFARPDSMLDEVSVYKTRLRLGEAMAHAWRKTGLDIDVVIPVPESARSAAQSMAQTLGVPCREGLVKSRYIGRTFIMANDQERKTSIRHKLNPIRLEFEGKRVLLLDDSIVRGNTATELVRMAREAGAEKVYLASYSPPLLYPCPYGIDMSTKREFIARDKTLEDLAKTFDCDAVLYQDLSDMVTAARAGNSKIERFCTACFDGEYPTGDITSKVLETIENERISVQV
ncbi:MAG: amidophosphoribosyltransferase [Planctomycetes bacterium]|nr:amidophosphoribosyltransferase [Planctomycetota bacterium]MCB9891266.1 amidophosphoribosyltransferase [Planctomycetota bacterium]MCB9919475.1 amidophosphoribosyltransferase [Planctomycetota bacterium]